ncbi:hypothetical protein [Amedibacillus sp. YH-ame10]
MIIKYDNIELHFCSQECKDETLRYFDKAKYLNTASIAMIWFTLMLAYILLSGPLGLRAYDNYVTRGLFLLLGFFVFIHPYAHKSLLVKGGIHKSRKYLRISGVIIMLFSILSIIKMF